MYLLYIVTVSHSTQTLYIHLPNKLYKKVSLPEDAASVHEIKIRKQNRAIEIELLSPFGNRTDVLYIKETNNLCKSRSL